MSVTQHAITTGRGGGNVTLPRASTAPGASAGGADLVELRATAEAAYARYATMVTTGANDAALDTAFGAYVATVERMAAIPARDVVGFAAKAAVAVRGVFDGFADCEAALMESLASDAAAVLA